MRWTGCRRRRCTCALSCPTIFALADIAVYLAILARIGPAALALTTSASIDVLRKPAPQSDLRAEVRVLKLGRLQAWPMRWCFRSGRTVRWRGPA